MRPPKPLPPLELLTRLLKYEPETGRLIWKVRRSQIDPGTVAGYVDKSGYILISVNQCSYKAHRIAYALYHGVDPYPMEIDHINRKPWDNRINNLRTATRSQQCKNQNRKAAKPREITGRKRKRPVKIQFLKEGKIIVVESLKKAGEAIGKDPRRVSDYLKGRRKPPENIQVEYMEK
jgi:hypothetical protein